MGFHESRQFMLLRNPSAVCLSMFVFWLLLFFFLAWRENGMRIGMPAAGWKSRGPQKNPSARFAHSLISSHIQLFPSPLRIVQRLGSEGRVKWWSMNHNFNLLQHLLYAAVLNCFELGVCWWFSNQRLGVADAIMPDGSFWAPRPVCQHRTSHGWGVVHREPLLNCLCGGNRMKQGHC